jgi:hypothetical protein
MFGQYHFSTIAIGFGSSATSPHQQRRNKRLRGGDNSNSIGAFNYSVRVKPLLNRSQVKNVYLQTIHKAAVSSQYRCSESTGSVTIADVIAVTDNTLFLFRRSRKLQILPGLETPFSNMRPIFSIKLPAPESIFSTHFQTYGHLE